MTTTGATAFAGFAHTTAEFVSDFASVIHNLIMDVRDSYRPGLHHLRGPGPKWRAKHPSWPGFDSGSVATSQQHQIRRCTHAVVTRLTPPDSQPR